MGKAVESLDQPCAQAVRHLVERALARAEDAAQRLLNHEDAEALHDYRVGLRRLRALTRAYAPCLQDIFRRKLRRRLRALAQLTGPARDAEVQLAWVDAQAQAVKAWQRTGWRHVHAQLLARREAEYAVVRAAAAETFPGFAENLRARLAATQVFAPRPTLAQVCAEVLQPLAVQLAADLAALAGHVDDGAVHEPRLLAKRVRYVLEPVADELPGADEALAQLKRWQDQLGDLHDLQVLSTVLRETAREAGARRYEGLLETAMQQPGSALPRSSRDERAGLAVLAQRLAAEQQAVLAELRAAVAAGATDRLLESLEAVIAALHAVPVALPEMPPEMPSKTPLETPPGTVPEVPDLPPAPSTAAGAAHAAPPAPLLEPAAARSPDPLVSLTAAAAVASDGQREG